MLRIHSLKYEKKLYRNNRETKLERNNWYLKMRARLRKTMIFTSRKKQGKWLSKILRLEIKLLRKKRKKDKQWAMEQIQIQTVMTRKDKKEGRSHRNKWKKYSNSKKVVKVQHLLLRKLQTKSGNRNQSYKCIGANKRHKVTSKSSLEIFTNQTKVKVTL